MPWASSPVQASSAVDTALGSVPAAGNLLVAYVQNLTDNTAPTSVKDGAGNAYTLLGSWSARSTNSGVGIYGLIVPASPGANQETVTVTAAGKTTHWVLQEWAGGPPTLTGIVDTSAAANAGAATNDTAAAPSVTTTKAQDLVLALFGTQLNNNDSYTYTGITAGPSLGTFGASGYSVKSATGTFNPSFTWTTSRGWSASTVALIPGSQTPAVTMSGAGTLTPALFGTAPLPATVISAAGSLNAASVGTYMFQGWQLGEQQLGNGDVETFVPGAIGNLSVTASAQSTLACAIAVPPSGALPSTVISAASTLAASPSAAGAMSVTISAASTCGASIVIPITVTISAAASVSFPSNAASQLGSVQLGAFQLGGLGPVRSDAALQATGSLNVAVGDVSTLTVSITRPLPVDYRLGAFMLGGMGQLPGAGLYDLPRTVVSAQSTMVSGYPNLPPNKFVFGTWQLGGVQLLGAGLYDLPVIPAITGMSSMGAMPAYIAKQLGILQLGRWEIPQLDCTPAMLSAGKSTLAAAVRATASLPATIIGATSTLRATTTAKAAMAVSISALSTETVSLTVDASLPAVTINGQSTLTVGPPMGTAQLSATLSATSSVQISVYGSVSLPATTGSSTTTLQAALTAPGPFDIHNPGISAASTMQVALVATAAMPLTISGASSLQVASLVGTTTLPTVTVSGLSTLTAGLVTPVSLPATSVNALSTMRVFITTMAFVCHRSLNFAAEPRSLVFEANREPDFDTTAESVIFEATRAVGFSSEANLGFGAARNPDFAADSDRGGDFDADADLVFTTTP